MILKVEAEDLSWEVKIGRRITIIKGDSGWGKTEMVRHLADPSEAVKIDFPMEYVVVTKTTWRTVVKNDKNKLLIFDDMEVIEEDDFPQMVKSTQGNGNYYLLISRYEFRDKIDEDGKDALSKDIENLSVAVSSILRMVTDDTGNKHYTKPYYDFVSNSISNIKIDTVVTEDSKGGYYFMRKLFKNADVEHADSGKSTVVRKVLELDKNRDKSVLVFMDMAAYGCHMEEFCRKLSDRAVYFIGTYECFEELLVSTKFFEDNEIVQNEIANLQTNANKFISWEDYYEHLVAIASNRKPFKVLGKNLNDCWLKGCDVCEKGDYIKCVHKSSGDKYEYLLKGTKYGRLLDLR